MSSHRRSLCFTDLDDAVRDGSSLLETGYERVGNWNLAQTCQHLSMWMRFPIDGFPQAPAPVRGVFWLLRHTIGQRQLRKMLASNSMPVGTPTIRSTVFDQHGDDETAVAELRNVVERFKAYEGTLHPSPIFGDLDHATATKLQLIHCAHHLSFLVPRDD